MVNLVDFLWTIEPCTNTTSFASPVPTDFKFKLIDLNGMLTYLELFYT